MEDIYFDLKYGQLYEKIENSVTASIEVFKDIPVIWYNEKYTFENVAYCGDDLNDLSCMIEVKKNGGVVGCPRNAVREIKETADFVANNKGGNGAVREFIDFLRYNDRLVENEKYSKDRSKV